MHTRSDAERSGSLSYPTCLAAGNLRRGAEHQLRNVNSAPLRLGGVVAGLVLCAWIALMIWEIIYPTWSDRVVLSDGRTLLVQQRREYHPGYGSSQSWLKFNVEERGTPITWNAHLYPVMLGVSDGKVYVVGRPRGYDQYRMNRLPKYMYVAFEYRNGKFERIPFLSVPESIRNHENVRWCFPGGSDERDFEVRSSPSWCDDMDANWPSPRKVDLQLRKAESLAWAAVVGPRAKPLSE
jgi:hypothetical protein